MMTAPLIAVVLHQPMLIIGIVAFCLVVILAMNRPKKASFPAGPKQYPLIGCMLDMPQDKQYLKFSEWKRTYGDIVGLRILGQNMLVLNSRQSVEDLLVKRGAVYSSRPPMTLLTKWGGFGWALFTLEYGAEMHTQRRLMNQYMNRNAIRAFDREVLEQALALIPRLHVDPLNFDAHLNTMGGAVIIKTTYGFDVKDQKNEWVTLSERMFDSFKKLTGIAAHPVDIIPQLSHLPPRVFGRQLSEDLNNLKNDTLDMLNLPFEALQRDLLSGKAPHSMTKALIEDNTQEDGSFQNEDSIRAIAGIAYIAGADTTLTTLRTFLIAMMLYPEVQRKAQTVIDAVVQDDRVPSLDDRESLLYIEAILKETLRWKPVAPLSVPHMSSEDDEYQGYHIPSGTVIFPNSWQCLQDEKDYPQPHIFRPERFMDGNELAQNIVDPRDFAFGFGRRICPGRHLAENVIWMNIALMLYAFDTSMPFDGEGKVIEPDLEYLSSPTISYAKKFNCSIKLRSPERLDAVKLAYEQLVADRG